MLHRLQPWPTQINLVGRGLHTKRIGGRRYNLPAVRSAAFGNFLTFACCRPTAGSKNECNIVHPCGPKHQSRAPAMMAPWRSRAQHRILKANQIITQSHARVTSYFGFDHAGGQYHFEPFWFTGCSGSGQRETEGSDC